ncbi:hypothetical protein COB72_03375 [bacterium]|nr:MAG: hypothetical protein COB72_03375 [bacterium]
MSAHNELIARVLARHNIEQVQLADECQLSESTISRIIHSQRVVTPEVLRALYKLTNDNELIAYLFDTKDFTLIKHINSDLPQQQIESLAVRACAAVLSDTGSKTGTPEDGIKRTSIIDEAITSLMTLRAKLAPANTGNTKPAFRRVAHPYNHSNQLDTVG